MVISYDHPDKTGLPKNAFVHSRKYLALNPAISSTADIHGNF
jgi:hypothetical protein